MDSRDRQIAILNCNTVAGNLASVYVQMVDKGSPMTPSMIDMIDAYETLFEAVVTKTLGAIGEAAAAAAFPAATSVETATLPAYTPGVPSHDDGDVHVVNGPQHGPLPAWLIDRCREAGVVKVYDARRDKDGNDITHTNRPWFKAADKNGPDGKPLPFWPPRQR